MARVSVIDDSADFLEMMGDLLSSLGHTMTGFEAVETSIEEVVDSKPELLVVDLRLGDTPQVISGWEILVLARSHRELRHVPVILCTADVWELKKRSTDLENIAGVHVRTKPFQMDEIIGLIGQLVGTAEPAAENAPPASIAAPR
jgi:two-component system response regulator PilR (NtrC family)/two-component system response regulator AtoC